MVHPNISIFLWARCPLWLCPWFNVTAGVLPHQAYVLVSPPSHFLGLSWMQMDRGFTRKSRERETKKKKICWDQVSDRWAEREWGLRKAGSCFRVHHVFHSGDKEKGCKSFVFGHSLQLFFALVFTLACTQVRFLALGYDNSNLDSEGGRITTQMAEQMESANRGSCLCLIAH